MELFPLSYGKGSADDKRCQFSTCYLVALRPCGVIIPPPPKLRTQCRALRLLGKHSTTDLNP